MMALSQNCIYYLGLNLGIGIVIVYVCANVCVRWCEINDILLMIPLLLSPHPLTKYRLSRNFNLTLISGNQATEHNAGTDFSVR